MYTRHAIVDTSLGEITLVAADGAVTGLYFPSHRYMPAVDAFGALVSAHGDPLLFDATQQLVDFLNGHRAQFDLELAAEGDEFQQRVWALVAEIPFGETRTYGELAELLGDRSLAQAVGQAVGRNPLCVIVPCHRVLGKDGRLTGYAGGLGRKRALLELEEPVEVSSGRLF